MIIAQLRYAPRYYGVHPRIQAACEFLMQEELIRPPAAVEIDGRNIVALFQEYETQPADVAPWETHDYHFDVQYLPAGEECVGYAKRQNVVPTQPYNAKDDYDLIQPVKGDYVTLKEDYFAIFFPEDAHQPRVLCGHSMPVKKICIKVLI
ncbi:MAG: YhcH/YjgK/YiaL family protein [Planctomycetes bacterium]|nr:YhcH/YjgK/YiaL family protein [Planctomycetota bacterium]